MQGGMGYSGDQATCFETLSISLMATGDCTTCFHG